MINRILTKPGYKVLLVIGLVVWGMNLDCKWQQQEHFAKKNCTDCHDAKRHNMADYFKRKGSPEPEVMANAVLSTKNPRLLAAIAVRESGGRPSLKNTGYKKQYSGAWQTHPRWGKIFSYDVSHQALVAEFALTTHLDESNGNIVKALNSYGGDKTHKQYAYNVLEELKNVP